VHSELRATLIKNFSAAAFGQVVNIIIQLISVPVFLNSWGVQLYGEWLILSSIPTYLSMSDFGFSTVAANEMTMIGAQGNRSGVLSIFQSIFILITLVSSIILIIGLPIIWMAPVEQWLNIHSQSHQQVVLILITFSLYVLLGQQSGVLSAGYRCNDYYAVGTVLGNLCRLSEHAGALLLVFLGASPTAVAIAFLMIRGGGYLWMRYDLHQKSPWLKFGWEHAKLGIIKKMIRPATSFMAFPLGLALNNQGITLVVSTILGAQAVVVFSVMRTLSRLALQVMNIISQAFAPQLSAAYGSGDLAVARNLHRKACQISIWLSSIIVLALLMCSQPIVRMWTQGKVILDQNLFLLMLLAVVGSAFWWTSSAALAATNRHQGLALRFLLGTSFSIFLAVALTPKLGLYGTAISVLITEAIMALYVLKASLRLLEDNLVDFTKVVASFPNLKRHRSRI